MATPLFVTSLSSVSRHGVYAIERKPTPSLRSTGTSLAAIVGQFPWGPTGTIFEPTDIGDAINTLAPPGFDRTGSAYLSLTGKAWRGLRIVRVIGADAAAATCALMDSPSTIGTITAKYKGTAGNSITAVVSDATDGDANHFKLTVSITGSSGTTTEILDNVNGSGTGTKSTFSLANSKLMASISWGTSGRPDNGSYTFSGGTSPAVVSGDYVGTEGTGDKGLSLLEGDRGIRHVCTDDPGNTIRAAVNAGLKAHAIFMGDRIAYLNGNSGLTAAASRTDAATYSSKQVVYVDPWYYKRDDVDGTERLVAPAPLAASVAANLEPSTSIAWKAVEVRNLLGEITRLEALRGEAASTNSDAGVVTIIKEETGGFSFESAHVTSYAAEASTGDLTRTRMAIYIVSAFAAANRTNVDAPNVPYFQNAIVLALNEFLTGLRRNRDTDPAHLPHIYDFRIGDPATVNTTAQIQSGQFIVPADVVTSAAMEKIALSLNIGPTVTLSANL
jgi:phage tail sheath protein FI